MKLWDWKTGIFKFGLEADDGECGYSSQWEFGYDVEIVGSVMYRLILID